jgi:mono/diheme cytochrome c family protein
MLRTFFALLLLGGCTVLALAGLRGTHFSQPPIEIFPDMDHQPKYQAQHPDPFFADGRSARKPVDGTVPMGYTLPGRFLQAGARNGTIQPSGFANSTDYLNTGRFGDVYGDGIPVDVTPELLDRGQERFDINCAICHGQTGEGKGVVQQIANWATVANLQDDRIRQQPDGQIYNTITHGKNTMGAYGPNIAIEDRWAIVAYIRALQKSQRAALADLPAEKQQQLQQQPAKK